MKNLVENGGAEELFNSPEIIKGFISYAIDEEKLPIFECLVKFKDPSSFDDLLSHRNLVDNENPVFILDLFKIIGNKENSECFAKILYEITRGVDFIKTFTLDNLEQLKKILDFNPKLSVSEEIRKRVLSSPSSSVISDKDKIMFILKSFGLEEIDEKNRKKQMDVL